MKRTNIVLDEKLVTRAKKATGIKTTREVVHQALREMIGHRRQRSVLKLFGKIHWEGDLDEMRRERVFP